MRLLAPLTLLLAAPLLAAPQKEIHVDDDAAQGGDGATWDTAFRRLQDALAVADDGDRILLADGFYRPDQGGGQTLGDRSASFVVPANARLIGGYRGLTGGGDPYDRDTVAFVSILSGDLDEDGPYDPENSFHVLRVEKVTARFNGLWIYAGSATNSTVDDDKRGGGLLAVEADVRLIDCRILSNEGRSGAAIYGRGSSLRLDGCSFENNRRAVAGSGIYLQGGDARLRSCEVIGSESNVPGSQGGAIYATAGAVVIGEKVQFRRNRAGSGGAVALSGGALAKFVACTFEEHVAENSGGTFYLDDGDLELVGGAVRKSRAQGADGGGAYVSQTSTLTANGTSFVSNFALQGDGGGVWAAPGAQVALTDCELALNVAGRGGALCVADGEVTACQLVGNRADFGGGFALTTAGSTLRIVESDLRENRGEQLGGAGYLGVGDSSIRLEACTLRRNEATISGGLFAEGEVGTPCEVIVVDCAFEENEALATTAVLANRADVTVRGSTFRGHRDGTEVASFLAVQGELARCTFAENEVQDRTMFVSSSGGGFRVVDSIIWNAPGTPDELDGNGFVVDYSCVAGGQAGTGNIADDPRLWPGAEPVFSLRPDSPCIDAGDPTSPPDPDGSRADMGARPFDPALCGPSLRYCAGAPNSVGAGATLEVLGSGSVSANAFGLRSAAAPPKEWGTFFYGPEATNVPMGDGTLCVADGGVGVFRFPAVQVGANGVATLAVDLTVPPDPAGKVLPGSSWRFQFWYRDANGPLGNGSNFSDAPEVIFCD